ncbi:Uncharacterised protein (plasmid) [Legionella adelaidensis]|uniref:Uncharacterized protein n=1 Tax=Legionella adelaidensis TaxID=45056 RepID=A0A0W0R2T7_9GAMM|nr:hypothetical protein [Legionella adelaidensis]KTC65377.1 hypothetical protein Lade_0035 [Legionella adelaidensis]VEH84801.1 Uncharacterised protein [Legionella adelaidensis]
MKGKHGLGILFFLLPFMTLAQGEALSTSLILDQVKVLKSSEKQGDELYFDINVYQPNQQISLVRVPQKPNHWPSAILDKIKQVPIWSASLKPGEAVTLIISLVDSDDFVLNPDDLIGSVRLNIKNENGTLKSTWSVPNQKKNETQSDNVQKFVIQNADSQYEVYFTLKS